MGKRRAYRYGAPFKTWWKEVEERKEEKNRKKLKKAKKDFEKALTSGVRSDIITGLSTRRHHEGSKPSG